VKFRARLRSQSFVVNLEQFGGLLTIRYCERKSPASCCHQLAEAEADVKKSLELSPCFPGPILLSRIYVMQGRPQTSLNLD